MLNKQNSEKIKIAILEISDQNKAILEFYFSSAGKSLYKEVPEANADAYITDYDYPGAIDHWEEISKTTNKPGIIISIREKQVPSTVWVAKPLTAKSVTEAATSIREMIIDSETPKEALSTTSDVVEQQIETHDGTIEEVVSEEVSEQKIGVAKVAENESKKIQQPQFEAELAIAEEGESALLPTTVEYPETPEHKSPDNSINNEIVDTIFDIDEQQSIDSHPTKDTVTSSQKSTKLSDAEEIDALLESLILGGGNKKPKTDEDNNDSEKSSEKLPSLVNEADSNVENPKQDLTLELDVLDADIEHHQEDSIPELKEEIETQDSLEEIQQTDSSDVESDTLDEIDVLNQKVEQELNQDVLATTLDSNNGSDLFDFDLESIVTDEKEGEDKTENIIEEDGSMLELDSHREIEDINVDDTISNTKLTIEQSHSQNGNAEEDITIESVEDFENTLNNKTEIKLNETKPKEASLLSAEQELQSLLNEIRLEADKNTSADGKNSDQSTPTPYDSKSTYSEENNHVQTNADKRWALLCGENENISKSQDVKTISFVPKNHMLALLLDQIKIAKNSEQVLRLKHEDIIIVIDSSLDSIYCSHSVLSEEYTNFCFHTINQEFIKVHDLDYSEVRMYRKKMDNEPEFAHSIESFIWTSSLLTARGRLPENTDITKTIGLKTWPNLTRLEQIPHVMNIAAVFSKNPGSLKEVPKWLNIPQRYIFAFYNAALALDMIELDSSKIKTSTFTFNTDNSSDKKASERGFFGRLLKRLTA